MANAEETNTTLEENDGEANSGAVVHPSREDEEHGRDSLEDNESKQERSRQQRAALTQEKRTRLEMLREQRFAAEMRRVETNPVLTRATAATSKLHRLRRRLEHHRTRARARAENHGGIKFLNFADGRSFEGEGIGEAYMYGKMIYPDGKTTHTGEFNGGIPHGYGWRVFGDRSSYEGEFEHGTFYGFGLLSLGDGGFYEGEWYGGRRQGYGKEVSADGSVSYEGNWYDGKPSPDEANSSWGTERMDRYIADLLASKSDRNVDYIENDRDANYIEQNNRMLEALGRRENIEETQSSIAPTASAAAAHSHEATLSYFS